jgi:diphthamide biosynthesis protein 3
MICQLLYSTLNFWLFFQLPSPLNSKTLPTAKMSYYDEIEIEDMTFDPTLQIYHYPCPCGDRFEISIGDMRDGEDVGVCPSCSLMIRVIFEVVSSSISLPPRLAPCWKLKSLILN